MEVWKGPPSSTAVSVIILLLGAGMWGLRGWNWDQDPGVCVKDYGWQRRCSPVVDAPPLYGSTSMTGEHVSSYTCAGCS